MSVCFIFCPWQWLRILPCFFRDYSDSTIYLPTKDLSWLLFPPWSTHCRYRLLILCVTKLDCLVWRICSLTVTAPFFTSFMIMMLHYYHRMTWSKVFASELAISILYIVHSSLIQLDCWYVKGPCDPTVTILRYNYRCYNYVVHCIWEN